MDRGERSFGDARWKSVAQLPRHIDSRDDQPADRGYLLEARGAPSRRPACPLHALEWARAALRQRTTSLGPFIPVLTRSRDRSRDKGDRVEIPGDPSVGFLQPQVLESSAPRNAKPVLPRGS